MALFSTLPYRTSHTVHQNHWGVRGDLLRTVAELMFPPLLPTECGLLLGEDECATAAVCAWAHGVEDQPGSCESARCDRVLEPLACLRLAPFLGCRFNTTYFYCHG